jgi:hypothetical protein
MSGSKFWFFFVLALAAWCFAACGGASSESASSAVGGNPAAPEGGAPSGDSGDAVQIEGLLGNIPQDDVERVLERKNDAIAECYQEALDVLEQIEGSVVLELDVGADGSVAKAYLRDGSLGSAGTEACIIALAKRLRFPKPSGGSHASISYPLTLEEPYGHPAPIDWSGAEAKAVVDANATDAERCLAGATGVQLTVYVGRGGAVVSAGATSDAPETATAAACLAEAALKWSFPDPGGATAKATISF